MDSKIVESYLSSISKAMVVARRAAPSSVRLASNDQKKNQRGGTFDFGDTSLNSGS